MKKVGVLVWALVFCLGSTGVFAADGAALAGKVCSSCHGMGKVEAAYKTKDKAAWTATVDRMLAKSNAPEASVEERAAIVDWLAEQK